jgi:methionyl aminopeptidase
MQSSQVVIHNEPDFAGMRRAGRLASELLDHLTPAVKPGISTLQLNDLAHDFTVKNNAIPAPLGYKGGLYNQPFPKSICTSVNHVVCHGIPSAEKVLKDGDIINIDVTLIVDGYYGDTSRMFIVGKPKPGTERLCNVTWEAMMLGIEKAIPGNTLRDIAIAIETHVKKYNFSCVREFCGHGIGRTFHANPQVMHFNDPSSTYQDLVLQPGMFFTIEPMVNKGAPWTIISKIDGWTATTRDKALSAQWEHTIGLNETGNEIFTKSS